MKTKHGIMLICTALAFVLLGMYSNIKEQEAKDRSKLPEKVEESRYFQRWITNVKNKDIEIKADEFKLLEEVEIFNTRWMKVTPFDDDKSKEAFFNTIEQNKNISKIVFAPSEREYVDYRQIERNGYKANEVQFFGLKETKIIDMRLVDCSVRANCYFDRAYFLNNDLLVVTEISRNIDRKDETTPVCSADENCTYTFKLHLIDMINNRRSIYESKPFEGILTKIIPDL